MVDTRGFPVAMALACFPVLALVSGLAVETGSPDALCPDVASTEDAIHARLGELEAEGARWRVRYTNGHAPNASSGDFVRLEIIDPEGATQLTRELPLAGESCATMAQVIALVVDRFFRTMVAEREDEPKATTAPQPEKPRDLGAAKREAAKREQAFAVAVQAGIIAPPLLPTVGIVFVRQWRAFSFGGALTWVALPATEELEAGGEAHNRSSLLRLVPSWDIGLGGARLAIGPTLAASAEWGSTTGLPESHVGFRTVFAAGGAAAVRVPFADRSVLELSGAMEAPFRPFGGEFVIDGKEVLAPPSVRGLVSLGFGPAWFW